MGQNGPFKPVPNQFISDDLNLSPIGSLGADLPLFSVSVSVSVGVGGVNRVNEDAGVRVLHDDAHGCARL
jgi:hypothetical protein